MSPPSAFGTYRVLHQIGSGVLGPVFRAYDSQSDRLAAVKVIRLDLVPEAAVRLADAFRRLIEAPSSVPPLVAVVDAGLEGATPFVALEYAAGESLDVVMRQAGAWPLGHALPVLRQIAAAIDAAWANGRGHGALHPRDIFISSEPDDVRLTGFGIAQALESVDVRVPVRLPYSAPERCAGGAWSVSADVFALGVIARELLTGQRVLGDMSESGDLVVADLGEDGRAALTEVLASACAADPEVRFASAIAFIEALEGVRRDPQPVRAPRVSRRRPVVLPLFETEGEPWLQPGDVAAESALTDEADLVFEPVPLPVGDGTDNRHEPGAVDGTPSPAVGEPAVAFPWAAVAAVLAAGLTLGAIGGYQFGWARGDRAARADLVAASIPSGTEVEATAPPAMVEPPPMLEAAPEPGHDSDPVRAAAPAPDGRLVVQSVPAGALVLLDGRKAGETPLNIAVPFGRHDVQIARSGYVPRTERIDLSAGSPSRTVRVQLERGAGSAVPAASTGSVEVDSRPRGARVTVDGRPVGMTPLRIADVAIGSHRIQIDLAGHRAVTSTVKVVSGELTRLAVTLEQGGAVTQGTGIVR